MSEDPEIYQPGETKIFRKKGRNLTKFQARRSRYIGICIDYLLGKPYSEIRRIHKVNNGYIQYALEIMGVKTNRIRSNPRLRRIKRGRFSQRLKVKMKENQRIQDRYNKKKRCCGSGGHTTKDNNPILKGDTDIMERMDNTDGAEDPICEIDINEEGEVFYDNG